MAPGCRTHVGARCSSKHESMMLADDVDQAIDRFRLQSQITWHVVFLWIWRLLREWRVFGSNFTRNTIIVKVL